MKGVIWTASIVAFLVIGGLLGFQTWLMMGERDNVHAIQARQYFDSEIKPEYYPAMEFVRSRMKDPWAVEFKALWANKHPKKGYVLCGLYNAKTGAGGYTGYTEFIAIPEHYEFITRPDESAGYSNEARLKSLRASISFLENMKEYCGQE